MALAMVLFNRDALVALVKAIGLRIRDGFRRLRGWGVFPIVVLTESPEGEKALDLLAVHAKSYGHAFEQLDAFVAKTLPEGWRFTHVGGTTIGTVPIDQALTVWSEYES